MSQSFRLTRRAEASLTEVARWTSENLGLCQAEPYEAEVLNRCEEILSGQAHSLSCPVLVDEADDLRFTRAGEHFLVFLDHPDEVVIVDILHARSDLSRHAAALTAFNNEDV